MPREGTTRTCLTLKSTQLSALKDLSSRTGAPVAELARRAVDTYLAGRMVGYAPPPQQAGPALDDAPVTPDAQARAIRQGGR